MNTDSYLEDVYDDAPTTQPAPATQPDGGDVRQRLVDLARPCAGLSYREETREAYTQLLFAGEDPARADQMARSMSSCGLFIRALWRKFGLRDERLEPPYHVGQVFAELHAMAHEAGAWRPASEIHDVGSGDAVFLSGPDHVLLVTDGGAAAKAGVFLSVDGGQRDAEGFYGVLRCERSFRRQPPALVGRWGARPVVGWVSWPDVAAKFG